MYLFPIIIIVHLLTVQLVCQCNGIKTTVFPLQKLLEEIENNKDKVDECHNYAKAYIDTIKVKLRPPVFKSLCYWNL